jgi:DUF1009 family protein
VGIKVNSANKIALIAGGGSLPTEVIEKLDDLRRPYVVLSIADIGPSGYRKFGLGKIGEMLEYLKEAGATEILFCGNVKRPSFFSLKLDAVGKKWLSALGVRLFLGDDALLKGVKRLIEKEGLSVIGAQSILTTSVTPKRLLTDGSKPNDMDLRDIARGIFVLNALSRADVGQAVVVQEGMVLGIEAAEGTSDLISRCKKLKLSPKGGVLVKIAKTGQEKSIDLPTIGPSTVHSIFDCGLNGIALGAHSSQIIDFENTIGLANKLRVFIIGC